MATTLKSCQGECHGARSAGLSVSDTRAPCLVDARKALQTNVQRKYHPTFQIINRSHTKRAHPLAHATNAMSEGAANSHRNILLTVDESPSSDKVFEYTVKNLYRQGAPVRGSVVHYCSKLLLVLAPGSNPTLTRVTSWPACNRRCGAHTARHCAQQEAGGHT